MWYYDNDYVKNILPNGTPARLMTVDEVKNTNCKIMYIEQYGVLDPDTDAFCVDEFEHYADESDRHHIAVMRPFCTSEDDIVMYHWMDYNKCVDGGWRCWTDQPYETGLGEDRDMSDTHLQLAPWEDDNGNKVVPDWKRDALRVYDEDDSSDDEDWWLM